MKHIKTAPIEHTVISPIANRWSPRGFSDREVSKESTSQFLEAARWAASAFNEQPWRYIIGNKHHSASSYQTLLDCLVPWNQAWAKTAPVLILVCSSLNHKKNNKPNKTTQFDTGLATAQLQIQAQSMDLYTHLMGGFNKEQAQERFNIPPDYAPIAVMALGYLGTTELLDQEYQEAELKARTRLSIQEIVFEDTFGNPYQDDLSN